MSVQWAHLGGEVLVATSHGASIQQLQFGALGLTDPMPDSLPATAETTRRLLDGAIAAAERTAPRVSEPPITALRWAWNLVSQWHCARHSVALLPDVIERCEAMRRPDLAKFARMKLEEEQGHDQFPLADLRALGYDAESLVHAVAPAAAVTAGLEYARSCVWGEQPVEFLGYMYALERRMLRLSDDWFATLEAVLPPGVDAVSGVRSHATELDIEHVDEAVAFIAGLPADDRTAIAIGCYRTTQICCGRPEDQIPSEAELERSLSHFRRAETGSIGPAAINTGVQSTLQHEGGKRG
jgi:hypothetical protein